MAQQKKLTKKEKIALSQTAAPAPTIKKKSKNQLKLSLGIIIAVFSFLLYAQTIPYTYTLDDYSTIKENHVVQQGLKGIGTLFSTSYRYGYWASNDELYRPLSLVLFAIEWQMFPDTPAFGHFINICLYAFTGFVLFNFLSRLFKNNYVISFIATLLFMAHPAHTEVVANIKSGDEILCLLFSVLTINWLLDYIETSKSSKLIFSILAFFAAMMAKESAVTMIIVIPFLLYVFKNLPKNKNITSVLPLLIPVIAYMALRNNALGGIVNTKSVLPIDNVLASAPNFFIRAMNATYVLGRYLILIIFPVHLSDDYSFSEINLLPITDWRILVSLVVYLALAGYALFKIRTKDTIAFGILFYLITISIVSNIVVIIGTVMADRLTFMPSLGFAMVVALLLTKLFKTENTVPQNSTLQDFLKANAKVIGVACIILALYSFKTVTRNPIWHDNMSLYLSGIEDAPNSTRNHYLYGIELKNRDAKNEKDSTKVVAIYHHAIEELKTATKIYPQNFDAYRDMAVIYHKMHDTVAAYSNYDSALKYNRADDKTYNNRGVIFFEAGQYQRALDDFTNAVRWNPRYSDAWKNLGSCYGTFGQYQKAIGYFQESLKYEKDNASRASTYHMMGVTYNFLKDEADANDCFTKEKQAMAGIATK
jgi:tetratricopeptide (TPR) repeat protein